MGRYLTPLETVHHLDGDRRNNRATNLVVVSRKDHQKIHRYLGDVGLSLYKNGRIKEALGNLDLSKAAFIAQFYGVSTW